MPKVPKVDRKYTGSSSQRLTALVSLVAELAGWFALCSKDGEATGF